MSPRGRNLGRRGRDQRGHRPDGERIPRTPAENRQQHALGQELAQIASGSGAEAARMASSRCRPRSRASRRVGDVGAGQQEHESHRREQHPEHRPDLGQRARNRARYRACAAAGLGVLRLEVAHDRGQLLARRVSRRRPGSEPARTRIPGDWPRSSHDRSAPCSPVGEYRSTRSGKNEKPRGSTPTTTREGRRAQSRCPTTDGSGRSGFARSRRKSSTAASAPGRSSDRPEVARPSAGRTPRSGQKDAGLGAARRSVGLTVPADVPRVRRYPAGSWSVRTAPRQSRKFVHATPWGRSADGARGTTTRRCGSG